MIRKLATLLALTSAAHAQVLTWHQALDAIRQVETGGCVNKGVGVIGDKGMSIGPYQIGVAYHTDAAQKDRLLTDYDQCLHSISYSERVVMAYMRRYARSAIGRLMAGKGTLKDVEIVSRIHNGGPRANRSSLRHRTDTYWAKVRREVYR